MWHATIRTRDNAYDFHSKILANKSVPKSISSPYIVSFSLFHIKSFSNFERKAFWKTYFIVQSNAAAYSNVKISFFVLVDDFPLNLKLNFCDNISLVLLKLCSIYGLTHGVQVLDSSFTKVFKARIWKVSQMTYRVHMYWILEQSV